MAEKQNMAQRPVLEVEQKDVEVLNDEDGIENHNIAQRSLVAAQQKDVELHDSNGQASATSTTQNMWTSFNITVDNHGQISPTVNLTSSLPPVKMQFLLQYKLKAVNNQLDSNKYLIHSVDNETAFLKVLMNGIPLDTIIEEVLMVFEEMTKTISTKILLLTQKSLRNTVLKDWYGSISSIPTTDVAVFDDGRNSIIIVGQKDKLESAIISLKQTVDDQAKRKREITIETVLRAKLLFHLDFQKYLKYNAENVETIIDVQNLKIFFNKTSKNDIKRLNVLMKKFLSEIVSKEWHCSEAILNLLKSTETRKYVRNRISQKNLKCYISLNTKEHLLVYSVLARDAEHAIAIGKASFQTIRIETYETLDYEIDKLLKQHHHKCVHMMIDDHLLEVTATIDIATEILSVATRAEQFRDSELPVVHFDEKSRKEHEIFGVVRDDINVSNTWKQNLDHLKLDIRKVAVVDFKNIGNKLEMSGSYIEFMKASKFLAERYSYTFGDLESKLSDTNTSDNYSQTGLNGGSSSSSSSSSDDDDDDEHINYIDLTLEEYSAFDHFFGEEDWYKKIRDKVSWSEDDKRMCLALEENRFDVAAIHATIQSKADYVKRMIRQEIQLETEEAVKKFESNFVKLQLELSDIFLYHQTGSQILVLRGLSYENVQTAKHRVSLALEQIKERAPRRHRRFVVDTASESFKITASDNNSYPSLPADLSFMSSSHSSSGFGASEESFNTPEGLKVKVYTGNILKLDVECIVNAANENLAHSGGIADVIARAAGYEFNRESADYVRKFGPIPVGHCCHTTAGSLHYKCVIHAVGPRWHSYNDKQQCKDYLFSAVEKSLILAEQLNLKSIAIPSVSAGIFAVPKDQCAQQYFRAVQHFSKNNVTSSSYLKEVHFIDKDDNMCGVIKQTFRDCFRMQPSVGHKHNATTSREENKVLEFQVNNRLKVHLYKGSIIEAHGVETIVCPEDCHLTSHGRIAKALREKGGMKYAKYIQSIGFLKYKEVAPISVGDILQPFQKVFLVYPPQFEPKSKYNCFEADLRETMHNILTMADTRYVKSVCVPLLGAAFDPKVTPAKICCENMVQAVSFYGERQPFKSALKEVHFVLNDAAAFSEMRDQCEGKFGKCINKDAEYTGMQQDPTTNTTYSEVDENEICCICMDEITEPKRIGCGHVFCTVCIDQQFQYKPACPRCNKAFGKLTGDQPPGTMEVIKKKSTHLKGYKSYGAIEVMYKIPSGRQTFEHPNPGKWYEGIYRSGYLPDNEKGNLVAKLLRVAFDRRLVFTIGRSRTTGAEGVVTWNDIHHKTRIEGGTQRFGYPDDTYLDRVLEELAAKGVTEASLDDP